MSGVVTCSCIQLCVCVCVRVDACLRVSVCVCAFMRAILCLNGLLSQYISDTTLSCCFLTFSNVFHLIITGGQEYHNHFKLSLN